MKNIFKILLAGLLVASCGEVEPVTFNGQEGGPNLLSFSRSSYNLPVVRDGEGSVDIVMTVSTLSSSDRVYNIELVPNNSALAANPATYTIPGTVTILAGQYSGSATILGVDGGLVDEVKRNFIIKVTNPQENDSMDSEQATVLIYEVCPLGNPDDAEPFLGQYHVEQTTSASPNTGEPLIAEGIYTLRAGLTEYDRYITFEPYVGFGLPAVDLLINFNCDLIGTTGDFDTPLSCEEDGGDPTFAFGESETQQSYNRLDDTTFDIKMSENIESACNGAPRDIIIRFTKVE